MSALLSTAEGPLAVVLLSLALATLCSPKLSAADVILAGLADTALLTARQIADLLPGNRGRMSARVVVRWMVAGVSGGLKLRSRRCGHRHCATVGDLREFLNARAHLREPPAPRPSPRSVMRLREQRAALARRAAEEALR